MRVEDLGTMSYREAWALQEAAHTEVIAGAEERILFVEHTPVITFGRRPDVQRNVIASDEQLGAAGVEVVQSDRGGDVTFHGPGQVVAYPIIRLNEHRLSVGGYVRALENAVLETLQSFGIASAHREDKAVGIWVGDTPQTSAKVCAIGVRIRRGVSLHGLALNVTTDLRYFNLIVPCGLVGRPVTSLAELLNGSLPPAQRVKDELAVRLAQAFEGSRGNPSPDHLFPSPGTPGEG
jgi:lipoate-protein ligase B